MNKQKSITLGKLCRIEKGKIGIQSAIPGEYPLVTTAEKRSSHNEFHFQGEAVCIPLVSATGHGHASIKRLHYQEGKFCVGSILAACLPKDPQKTSAKFLHLYLSLFKDSILVPLMQGSANVSLKIKDLEKVEIPNISLREQLQIISLIEKLKIKQDEILNELDKQQFYLQLLRQTILQDAVQGKLTNQDEADEPANELLKRIKAEKKKLVKEGKLKKEKELPNITKDEAPFELPKGWAWCRLGEIGKINPRNNFDDNKEVSFIPMNLISADFGVAPKFEVRKWKEVKTGFTHFAENDIAIAKITPCFENSKSGIFTGLINGIGAGTTELHVFRGDKEFIIPDYVYLFFKSPNFLNVGKSKMTGSAGQKRVPSDFIKNCIFPLPPFKEQKRIAFKANQLINYINQLNQQVTETQSQAQQLMQAVLKEVFEESEKGVVASAVDQSAVIPFERKVLAGHIIHLFNNEKHFGLTKFQKTFCVCEYHAQVEYEMNYEQEVAGPYDREFTLAFRKEMQVKDWFREKAKTLMTHFQPGANVRHLIDDYNALFDDKRDKISFVLKLFKGKTLLESELIATLYAVWNDRIIRKQSISLELLSSDIYSWSERKSVYNPKQIIATHRWMLENGLVPTGFGKEISKPKAKQ